MEIINTNDTSEQYKSYLIFGGTKTGKTLLSATLPEGSVLLADSEHNLDSIYGANITVTKCETFEEFMDKTGEIMRGEVTPEWFFLDSGSDLMTKIFGQCFEKFSDGRQAYADFERKYHDVISRIKALPCNVVVIGRMAQVKDEITGGLINGAALPWAKLQSDLPFNFSAVLATRATIGEDGKTYYSIQCQPDSQYQVGARTQFGKPNPLKQFEEPDLEAIHNKLTQ